MAHRFNPPPNWPAPAPGWQPPPGWQPDPAWGPPPPGWALWVDEQGRTAVAPTKKGSRTGLWIAAGVVGGIVLVCGLGAAIGAGGDSADEPAARASSTTGAPAGSSAAVETTAAAEETSLAEPAPEAAAAVIGTPVRDGKFEFVVTGVERVGSTVGEGFLEETAQGEFVIVRIDVTNIGDQGQTLSSSGQVLINDKGQELEPSSAIFSLPDADKFFLENINPGNTVTGAPLLFDVAPGTVLDGIELHDSPFSGGVTVSLAGS